MKISNTANHRPGYESPVNNSDNSNYSENEDIQGGVAIINEKKPALSEPPKYKVLLHNDDYTPMEFVVMVLKEYFRKSENQATEIMLAVHNKGVGLCGIYIKDVAETKVAMVTDSAVEYQFPLKCTFERA